MRITIWKALGMAGVLANGLTEAASDGKITIDEAIKIALDLAVAAGLPIDNKGATTVIHAINKLSEYTQDGRVTIAEITELAETVCADLGIELDKTGINLV